jgi:hypothetical protein
MKKKVNLKAQEAILELIRLCIASQCAVEFSPPNESPQEVFGDFVASEMKIYVYKDRTVPFSAIHAFVLAHEYRHLRQYIELKYPQHWLFQIGAVEQTPTQIKDELETEADEFAIQFLKERKIRVPRSMLNGVDDE